MFSQMLINWLIWMLVREVIRLVGLVLVGFVFGLFIPKSKTFRWLVINLLVVFGFATVVLFTVTPCKGLAVGFLLGYFLNLISTPRLDKQEHVILCGLVGLLFVVYVVMIRGVWLM